MNKYQLYTLGGALLAATTLSASAQAASYVGIAGASGMNVSARSASIANTAISSTATTADAQIIGGATTTSVNPAFMFLNGYNAGFNLKVTVSVSGATFGSVPTAKFLIGNSTNGSVQSSAVTTVSYTALNGTSNATSVSKLSNQIILNNVRISFSAVSLVGNGYSLKPASAQIVGVILEGLSFTTANGLATVGGTVSLGATIADTSTTYETIATSAVVTSVAPVVTTVTAGSATTISVGSGATLFTSVSGGNNTITLATVNITGVSAVGTDLSTVITADGSIVNTAAASGSVTITVTDTALSDPAASGLRLIDKNGVSYLATKSNFSSGSQTFTLAVGSATYSGTSSIVLAYSGTQTISAAAAGTVSVAYSIGGASLQTLASASGSTGTVNVGGLSSQVNWANAGNGSGFTSYVRIHNLGSTAAPAVIVVKKDTTDGSAISTLGSYTTGTVPAGGTIQVPVAGTGSIEAGLGINSSAVGGSYTLLVTGAFPGYIQHLSYNGTSLFDLSGFRNGTDGTNSSP